MEIHPVRAALTCVDRRTDMTKVIEAFCNYVNVPKNPLKYAVYNLNCLRGVTQSCLFAPKTLTALHITMYFLIQLCSTNHKPKYALFIGLGVSPYKQCTLLVFNLYNFCCMSNFVSLLDAMQCRDISKLANSLLNHAHVA